MTRYEIGQDLPPFSADGVTAVVDSYSDNGDVLVHVDPDGILSEEARTKLARIITAAMVAANFEPEYQDA